MATSVQNAAALSQRPPMDPRQVRPQASDASFESMLKSASEETSAQTFATEDVPAPAAEPSTPEPKAASAPEPPVVRTTTRARTSHEPVDPPAPDKEPEAEAAAPEEPAAKPVEPEQPAAAAPPEPHLQPRVEALVTPELPAIQPAPPVPQADEITIDAARVTAADAVPPPPPPAPTEAPVFELDLAVREAPQTTEQPDAHHAESEPEPEPPTIELAAEPAPDLPTPELEPAVERVEATPEPTPAPLQQAAHENNQPIPGFSPHSSVPATTAARQAAPTHRPMPAREVEAPVAPKLNAAAALQRIGVVVRGAHEMVRLDIRQASGAVRVAVHSDDNALAGRLRESLPELVGRLQEQGFQPRVAEVPDRPRADDQRQSQRGDNEQPQQRQRQQRRRQTWEPPEE